MEVDIQAHKTRGRLCLQEPGHSAKKSGQSAKNSYSVSVSGVPNDAIAIKIDQFPLPDKLLADVRSQRRRADFAIISEEAGKKFIVFIEMSKGKKQESEVIQQLKGAQCVISYCQKAGIEFWNKSDFLKDYENRFVSLTNVSMNKQRTVTRRRDGKKHDSPEKMLKINAPHGLNLSRLIGKK